MVFGVLFLKSIAKKLNFLFFPGIALLFAVVLACCSLFPSAESLSGIEYERPLRPGEFLVSLNGEENRALTDALARAGSDFYEVVLAVREGFAVGVDGTEKVYRTTFREGKNGRMEAPVLGISYNNDDDGYGNGNFAYIFAGRYSDKTLLGIGVLTGVEYGYGIMIDSQFIDSTTRRVQFTLQALKTNVTSDYTTDPASSPSTFRPWKGSASSLPMPSLEDFCAKIMINERAASVFLFPPEEVISDAEYDVAIDTPSHFLAAVVHSDYQLGGGAICSNYIWLDEGPPPSAAPPGRYVKGTGGIPGPVTAEASITNQLPQKTLELPLKMAVDTNPAGASIGLGRISIEIPLVILTEAESENQSNPDLKKPVKWFLRGGINNSVIDMGPFFNENLGSMGGAILIGIGIDDFYQ